MTTTAPEHQTAFDLRIPARRPLMGVWQVAGRIDVSVDEVLAMIEDGRLPWAFNIASKAARMREVRVLTRGLTDWERGVQIELNWDDVLGAILPHDKPFIAGTELQRALNCGHNHVMVLLADGSLRVVPDSDWGRGPNGSPAITRDSVVAFLKQRRMT